MSAMEGRKGNTINICVGHLAFPSDFRNYVDLMIAPCIINDREHVRVVDDNYFGEYGSSLSEYSQLLWLYDQFDAIIGEYDYVRILQYRKFVARRQIGEPSSNQGWARWIRENQLRDCPEEFSRFSTSELFNTAFTLGEGILYHYATYHVLSDFINFSKFLLDYEILDSQEVARFMTGSILIPASSMGVFRRETLREILAPLRRAAEFIKTPYFVPRTDYQRRVLGFLLERLNSYLILSRIDADLSEGNFGHHTILSDGPIIEPTSGPIG